MLKPLFIVHVWYIWFAKCYLLKQIIVFVAEKKICSCDYCTDWLIILDLWDFHNNELIILPLITCFFRHRQKRACQFASSAFPDDHYYPITHTQLSFRLRVQSLLKCTTIVCTCPNTNQKLHPLHRRHLALTCHHCTENTLLSEKKAWYQLLLLALTPKSGTIVFFSKSESNLSPAQKQF